MDHTATAWRSDTSRGGATTSARTRSTNSGATMSSPRTARLVTSEPALATRSRIPTTSPRAGSRRTRRQCSGRGTAASLLGLSVLLISVSVGWARGDQPPRHEKPPRPLVQSHGQSDHAKRGSYCWPQSDGETIICATAHRIPIPTRRSVSVHGGSAVSVDLRHAATSLAVLDRQGSQYAEPCQVDDEGRYWRFQAPPTPRRSQGVLLQVEYPHGEQAEAEFGIQLERHEHSSLRLAASRTVRSGPCLPLVCPPDQGCP